MLADIDSKTLNIDVNVIRDLITPRTKAIITVHYAGLSCDMDQIIKIAKEFDIM